MGHDKSPQKISTIKSHLIMRLMVSINIITKTLRSQGVEEAKGREL